MCGFPFLARWNTGQPRSPTIQRSFSRYRVSPDAPALPPGPGGTAVLQHQLHVRIHQVVADNLDPVQRQFPLNPRRPAFARQPRTAFGNIPARGNATPATGQPAPQPRRPTPIWPAGRSIGGRCCRRLRRCRWRLGERVVSTPKLRQPGLGSQPIGGWGIAQRRQRLSHGKQAHQFHDHGISLNASAASTSSDTWTFL